MLKETWGSRGTQWFSKEFKTAAQEAKSSSTSNLSKSDQQKKPNIKRTMIIHKILQKIHHAESSATPNKEGYKVVTAIPVCGCFPTPPSNSLIGSWGFAYLPQVWTHSLRAQSYKTPTPTPTPTPCNPTDTSDANHKPQLSPGVLPNRL